MQQCSGRARKELNAARRKIIGKTTFSNVRYWPKADTSLAHNRGHVKGVAVDPSRTSGVSYL